MSSVYSWTRFAKEVGLAAAGRRILPGKLIFVVTKRCHSRCSYCDIWKVKDEPGALDAELSLGEVELFARRNSWFQWIDFTGGEPTDRPDFEELVCTFDRLCPDLLLAHFPTNGIATQRISSIASNLHARLRARLVVTVSIDGPPGINDKLRGIRNDFAHAMDTYCALRRILGDDNCYVGMTLHGHSGSCGMSTKALVLETFRAINDSLSSRGEPPLHWRHLHVNIPHLSQHYYGNQQSSGVDGFAGVSHRAEIQEAIAYVAAQSSGGALGMRFVEKVYRKEASTYLESGHTDISCSALLMTTYLSEKGVVYPCSIWDKPLGSIRESNYDLRPVLQKAWDDGTRQAVAKGACPRCWTPCEAYPAIMASPLKSLRTFFKDLPA